MVQRMVAADARRDGERYGAARVPLEAATGEEAAPNRCIDGATKAEKGTVKLSSRQRRMGPRKQVASTEARKEAAKVEVKDLRKRIKRLRNKRLPAAELKLAEARGELNTALDGFMALPRMARGYFDRHRVVVLAAVGVVVFDIFLLHVALALSGAASLVVWGTSVTVPLAIAAANEGFGRLAGAIGLQTPGRHRLKLAAALFITGLGAMVVAFAMLMVFRAEATSAFNAALVALAHGGKAKLTFLVSPLWMGPLQIAGSLAVITLTALWTMAKGGREYREEILEPAKEALEQAEREREREDQKLEVLEQQLGRAKLRRHEIESEKRNAQVEDRVLESMLAAELEIKDGDGEASKGRYETEYIYNERIFKNGGVWRVAMATVLRRFRSPYTPGPTDVSAEEQLIEERQRQTEPKRRRTFWRSHEQYSPNGKHERPVDPDNVTKA